MSEELYLGVDGGQSHTEAVIANGAGNILGRGRGGPSNHAEQPGGHERLLRAVVDSVTSALRAAGQGRIADIEFAAAHCAMTGGADYKEGAIASVLRARRLAVGHDAPAALAGAMAGEPGLVIIAGTGAVAYGERDDGRSLRIGGWGFLFGDEGSGFWISVEGVRRAMRAFDGVAEPTVLGKLALEHFGVPDLGKLAMAVYHEEISRDQLARFAATVHRAAAGGDEVAREIIAEGGRFLARLAATSAQRLEFRPGETSVGCVGGVFRGELVREAFAAPLRELWSGARVVEPRFDPAVGALLLAYRLAGRQRTDNLLSNLARQSGQKEHTRPNEG